MSKKKGHRRKRKKLSPLCPKCHEPADMSAGAWLKALAGLLNDAEQAGVKIKVRHGIMMTREGYVLPRRAGRWGVGLLADYGTPLSADEDWDED